MLHFVILRISMSAALNFRKKILFQRANEKDFGFFSFHELYLISW